MTLLWQHSLKALRDHCAWNTVPAQIFSGKKKEKIFCLSPAWHYSLTLAGAGYVLAPCYAIVQLPTQLVAIPPLILAFLSLLYLWLRMTNGWWRELEKVGKRRKMMLWRKNWLENILKNVEIRKKNGGIIKHIYVFPLKLLVELYYQMETYTSWHWAPEINKS